MPPKPRPIGYEDGNPVYPAPNPKRTTSRANAAPEAHAILSAQPITEAPTQSACTPNLQTALSLYEAIKHKAAALAWRRAGRDSQQAAREVGRAKSTLERWRADECWGLWADAADAAGIEQAAPLLESTENKCRVKLAQVALVMARNALALNRQAEQYRLHPEKYGREYGKDAAGFQSLGHPTISEIATYSKAAQDNANKLFGWDVLALRAEEGFSSPADSIEADVLALLAQMQEAKQAEKPSAEA